MIPLYIVEIGRQRAAHVQRRRRTGLRGAAGIVVVIVALITVAATILGGLR